MLQIIKERFQDAQALETKILAAKLIEPSSINKIIEGILEGTAATLGDITSALATISTHSEVWASRVYVGMLSDPRGLTGFALDSVAKTITANQDAAILSVFGTVFEDADIIRITNAEDATNNGFYTIATAGVATTVLTLDDGPTLTNADDKTMIIELFKR